MPDSAEKNALYQEWLEIPEDRLPPNHYALLGLADFESDLERIESAAKSRSAYLHQIAAGPKRKIVQEMLGQVAIARRTLLSDESKSEYDDALRSSSETTSHSDSPSSDAERDKGKQGVPSGGSSESPADESGASPTRNKPSDWKYHGISAAVLLAIVGIIFWVNRNPGGRRAAQARISEPAASETESLSTPTSPGQANQHSAATTSRKANQSQPSTDSSISSRRSPIARKRETGSGLGAELGNKFSTILSEIAEQGDNDPAVKHERPSGPKEFRPLGGLAIGPAKMIEAPVAWLDGVALIAEFPTQVAERFSCAQGFDWFETDETKLAVRPASGENAFALTDKQFHLTLGSTIALTTSLSAGMRSDMHVGFEIDGIRIGIRPIKNGIEVYARDRGEDSRIDSVCKITTTTESSMIALTRDAEKSDSFRWSITTDDQMRTGLVGATSLGEAPSTSIFIVAPRNDSGGPFWITDYKTRSGES